MMKQNKIIYQFIIVIVLSFILSFYFYKNKINEFPSYIHAWTQSDRYAVALRFTDNGYNFFKPATFNLHPDKKIIPVEEKGITPVDFPLNEYVVALLMKTFGTKDPWVFRMYNLLYGIIGLFFLSLLIFKRQNIFLGSFVFIFIFTSPVFTYYLAGFLPTITSISSFCIGLYFFINYIDSKKRKYFYISITFLTLAALCRTPFIVPLTAIVLHRFITYFRNKRIEIFEIIAIVAAYLFFIFYFIYNLHLKYKYGSAFLGEFLPPKNLHEIKQIIIQTYNNWHLQYFTVYHYILFIIGIGIFIFQLLKSKKINSFQKQIMEIGLIAFVGSVIYAFLMLSQFVDHDYYFYDTFFPVIILFLIFLFSFISFDIPKWSKIISIFILLVFSFFMITSSKAIQKKRRVTGDWDRVEITKNNFWNSNVYLDSIGIPRNAKILVIDAYTTNIPLILMNRMGYTVLKTSEDEIKKSLTWNYDYIVIQNCFLLSDVVKNYPDIINCLEKINGNGKITIFKHLKSFQKTNLLEFLGLDKQKPCWTNSINFDTISASCWRNTNATKDIYYSKPSSGILSEKDEYGLTFSLKDSKEISEQEHQLMFQAKVFTKKHIIDCTCKIVVSVNCNNENVLYQSYDLNTLFKNSNQWNDIQLLLTIPKTNTSENELSVYFWNPNKSSICYDDIRLDLY